MSHWEEAGELCEDVRGLIVLLHRGDPFFVVSHGGGHPQWSLVVSSGRLEEDADVVSGCMLTSHLSWVEYLRQDKLH